MSRRWPDRWTRRRRRDSFGKGKPIASIFRWPSASDSTSSARKQGGHTVDLALAIDDLAVDRSRLRPDGRGGAARRPRCRAIADESAADCDTRPSTCCRRLSTCRATASSGCSRRPSDAGKNRAADRFAASVAHRRVAAPTRRHRARRRAAVAGCMPPISATPTAPRCSPATSRSVMISVWPERMATAELKMPWLMPRQDFQPGVPWHIQRLASRSGHRAGADEPAAHDDGSHRRRAEALVDRTRSLAVGVSLMDPSRLKDSDRRCHRGGNRPRARSAVGAAVGSRIARCRCGSAGLRWLAAAGDVLGSAERATIGGPAVFARGSHDPRRRRQRTRTLTPGARPHCKPTGVRAPRCPARGPGACSMDGRNCR